MALNRSGSDGADRRLGRSVSVLAALAVLALVTAGGALLPWSIASGRVDDQRSLSEAVELLEHRTTIARTLMDELNLRLAGPLIGADPRRLNEASAARVETINRELLALEELADGDGSVADEARELLQEFRQWGPTRRTTTPGSLYEGAMIAHFDGFSAFQDSRVTHLSDLVWIDEVLTLTLNELAIARLTAGQPEMPSELALFVEDAAPSVMSFGGGYVGDGPYPLDSSLVFIEDATLTDAPTLDELNALLLETDLQAMNRWLADLVESPDSEPPIPFDVFYDQTTVATAEVRAILDGYAQDLEESFAEDTNWLGLGSSSWLTAAGLLLATSIGLTVRIVVLLWRRSKALRELVNLDPLTGVGNRNMLTERTAALLYRDQLKHHVIITIDLDRFKVINDSFGHAAGDRMLIHLATEFDRLAGLADVEASSVIRLGGDEFLISLHHDRPIATDSILADLDRLRATIFVIDDETDVQLGFSYGIASAEGSPPLSQLMDASDLAAYEEKAARRPGRVDIAIIDTVDAR